MKIYCTICSREKTKDARKIEAIKRYKSQKIKSLYEKSQKDHVEFRILSGKFGLLKPDEKIEYYDKLLIMADIPKLAKIIKKQIFSQNINEIVFFAIDPKQDIYSKPYLYLMKKVCSENKIPLKIKFVK
jgi:hypothetical protein